MAAVWLTALPVRRRPIPVPAPAALLGVPVRPARAAGAKCRLVHRRTQPPALGRPIRRPALAGLIFGAIMPAK